MDELKPASEAGWDGAQSERGECVAMAVGLTSECFRFTGKGPMPNASGVGVMDVLYGLACCC